MHGSSYTPSAKAIASPDLREAYFGCFATLCTDMETDPRLSPRTTRRPSISIVINNYNYGRFLQSCIQSVLEQSEPADEIVVVDDGSTDDSRFILEPFRQRVTVIIKENGGQASALNAGFEASSGDWVWFLDADDWLAPHAVSEVRKRLSSDATRIIFPLTVTRNDVPTKQTVPSSLVNLMEAQAPHDLIQRNEFFPPPTSGNVFNRRLLQDIMPIPEDKYQIAADLYLSLSQIATQTITSIMQPLGFYRIHGSNLYFWKSQFISDRPLIRRRALTICNYIHLYRSEIFTDRAANASAAEPVSVLHLSQLKDLIIASRILEPSEMQSAPDFGATWVAAIKSVRREYRGFSLWMELSILLLLRFSPMRLFPILGGLEQLKKKVHRASCAPV